MIKRLLGFFRKKDSSGDWTEAELRAADHDQEAAELTQSWRKRSIPGVTETTAEDPKWPLTVKKSDEAE
jgi:hypothetical protein